MGTPLNQLNRLKWTTEDLDKKFRDSFLLATLKGVGTSPDIPSTVCYIRSINEDGVRVQYQTGKKGPGATTDQYFAQSRVIVEEDRPIPCLTNHGDTALAFTYNPDRQWKRGIGPYNGYLLSLKALKKNRENAAGHPKSLMSSEFNFSTVAAILTPSHTPLLEALSEFQKDPAVVSRAVSNTIWLCRGESGTGVELYRGKVFLGSFVGKKFFQNSDFSLFKEELKIELPKLEEYNAWK